MLGSRSKYFFAHFFVICGCLSLAGNALGATPSAAKFAALLQEMWDGRSQSLNREVAERTLAESYREIVENGDTSTKAEIVASRTAERGAQAQASFRETGRRVTIKDVEPVIYGRTAVVHYNVDTTMTLNGAPVRKVWRCTETFVKERRGWRSVSHTETAIPLEPIAVPIDTRVYDDYVGRYRLSESIIYSVTRDGERLMWGRNRNELVPETETTFAFRRNPERKRDLNTLYRVTFVRDSTGRVTGLRMREFPGVEYTATRIDPAEPQQ